MKASERLAKVFGNLQKSCLTNRQTAYSLSPELIFSRQEPNPRKRQIKLRRTANAVSSASLDAGYNYLFSRLYEAVRMRFLYLQFLTASKSLCL